MELIDIGNTIILFLLCILGGYFFVKVFGDVWGIVLTVSMMFLLAYFTIKQILG